MNTRRKIIKLFEEGKSPDEIIELLKEEKVSNIRSYVSRVKRDLKDKVTIAKNQERIDKPLCKVGMKGKRWAPCKCVNCGGESDIHTNNKAMYQLPIVRENWLCIKCMYKVHRVLITCTCKCGGVFKTKVLEKNKDKYGDFKCTKCMDL